MPEFGSFFRSFVIMMPTAPRRFFQSAGIGHRWIARIDWLDEGEPAGMGALRFTA